MSDGPQGATDSREVTRRSVRFAVVGLGLMGERHCQVIQSISSAELAGVCDVTTAVAKTTGAKFQVAVYADFEQLLASDNVDAVVICLPSGLHAEFGIRAARAGKHVIVEKPIDSDLEQAERLVRECEARELICAVISQYRYGAGLRALKWAVDSGAMGRTLLARASVKWFRDDEYYTQSHWRGRRAGENGGVLINQAVHAIDTLQWIFGEPKRVACFTLASRPDVMETEDTATALFAWPDGLVATLEASTSAAPGFGEMFELNSSTASLRVDKGNVDFWWHKNGLELPAELWPGESDPHSHADAAPGQLNPKLQLFARQYENIVSAITAGAELDVRPEQAVAVVRTITRLYKSADSQP